MIPDRVWLTASTLLDEVATRVVAAGGTVPERRYVAIGLPALDCEQLVVSIDRVTGHEGNPSVETNNPVRCLTMRAVELSIWLLRCAPTMGDDGTPPSAAALNASSEEVAFDPPRVLQAVLDSYRDGALGSLWGVVFLDWRALTPQGGLVGGQQRVRYDLSAPVP